MQQFRLIYTLFARTCARYNQFDRSIRCTEWMKLLETEILTPNCKKHMNRSVLRSDLFLFVAVCSANVSVCVMRTEHWFTILIQHKHTQTHTAQSFSNYVSTCWCFKSGTMFTVAFSLPFYPTLLCCRRCRIIIIVIAIIMYDVIEMYWFGSVSRRHIQNDVLHIVCATARREKRNFNWHNENS